MMRRFRLIARLAGALVLLVFLLIFPETALIGAQRAMAVWAFSVAPALFPFLMLLPTLTCAPAQRAYEKLMGWLVRPVFKLPGSAAAAIVTGMLAGSPAGALASARVGTQGGMETGAFKRMALMGVGVGPVYLVSGLGVALFGSVELGLWLAAAQMFSQLAAGVALRGAFTNEKAILSGENTDAQNHPVLGAAINLLQICGYMVFFSVVAALAARIAGEESGNWLLYILDLPSGAAAATEVLGQGLYPLLGGMVGFAGLCIGFQNMAILKPLGVKWSEYLSVKCFTTLLCAGVMALVYRTGGAQSGGAAYTPALELAILAALFLAIPAVIKLIKSNS